MTEAGGRGGGLEGNGPTAVGRVRTSGKPRGLICATGLGPGGWREHLLGVDHFGMLLIDTCVSAQSGGKNHFVGQTCCQNL